jgi:hypothetical protein
MRVVSHGQQQRATTTGERDGEGSARMHHNVGRQLADDESDVVGHALSMVGGQARLHEPACARDSERITGP